MAFVAAPSLVAALLRKAPDPAEEQNVCLKYLNIVIHVARVLCSHTGLPRVWDHEGHPGTPVQQNVPGFHRLSKL